MAAAKRRGKRAGQPQALDQEKIDQIIEALEAGVSKSAVCRTFSVARSTLIDTLARIG
ncbi:helix-turn-helix domain-containing protein [Tianweitania populi]